MILSMSSLMCAYYYCSYTTTSYNNFKMEYSQRFRSFVFVFCFLVVRARFIHTVNWVIRASLFHTCHVMHIHLCEQKMISIFLSLSLSPCFSQTPAKSLWLSSCYFVKHYFLDAHFKRFHFLFAFSLSLTLSCLRFDTPLCQRLLPQFTFFLSSSNYIL